MSKLTLMGVLCHANNAKYISFVTTNGNEHLLPIVAPQDFEGGTWVFFSGQLCTVNVRGGDGKLHKQHFGEGSLQVSQIQAYKNELQIPEGVVVWVDEIRATVLTQRTIVDFIVADGSNFYNCIAFGSSARRIADIKVGSPINVSSAMFQSRAYSKNGEPRVAYEVCVKHFV